MTTIGGVRERHEEEKGKLSRQGGGHKQDLSALEVKGVFWPRAGWGGT